jgi:hypothetical protein
MKKTIHLFLVFLFFSSTWWVACKKESTAENSLSNAIVGDRGDLDQYSEEDALEFQKTIEETTKLKLMIDDFLAGNAVEIYMESDKAAESVEMVFNQYLSYPGTCFQDEKISVDSAEIDEPGTWGAEQIAKMYVNVREVLSKHYNETEGSEDKRFRFVDIGAPVATPEGFKVYLITAIGWNEAEKPYNIAAHNPLEVRWAEQRGFPFPSSYGYTVTSCTGEANEEIGKAANSQIGFFLKNLPPSPIVSGNPNVNPSVQILSPIAHVQTNLFRAEFPLGNTPAPLFIVSTFYKNSTFAPNPNFVGTFLDNQVNIGNQSPNYLSNGQYKIHGDVSFSPSLPDENCFNLTKLSNYGTSNRDVGNFYVPQVNQAITGSQTPPISQRRRLIGTFVRASDGTGQTGFPAPNDIALKQEHPTYHFYSRTAKVFIDIDIKVTSPGEM